MMMVVIIRNHVTSFRKGSTDAAGGSAGVGGSSSSSSSNVNVNVNAHLPLPPPNHPQQQESRLLNYLMQVG